MKKNINRFTLIEALAVSVITAIMALPIYVVTSSSMQMKVDAVADEKIAFEGRSITMEMMRLARRSIKSQVIEVEDVLSEEIIINPRPNGGVIAAEADSNTASLDSISIDELDFSNGRASIRLDFTHPANESEAEVLMSYPGELSSGEKLTMTLKASLIPAGHSAFVRIGDGQGNYREAALALTGGWQDIVIDADSFTTQGDPTTDFMFISIVSSTATFAAPQTATIKIDQVSVKSRDDYADNGIPTMDGNAVIFEDIAGIKGFVYDPSIRAIFDLDGVRLTETPVFLEEDQPFASIATGYPQIHYRLIRKDGLIYRFKSGGESRYGR